MRMVTFAHSAAWRGNLQALASRLAFLLLGALSLQCASQSLHGPLWAPAMETYPSQPFRLEIHVSAPEAEVGSILTVEYTLTNTTNQAIAACAANWSDYHLIGAKRDMGQASVNVDFPHPDMVFRIPPHASMVWHANIAVPDVGAGPSRLSGMLRSSCSLWTGLVVSEPVPITITSSPVQKP